MIVRMWKSVMDYIPKLFPLLLTAKATQDAYAIERANRLAENLFLWAKIFATTAFVRFLSLLAGGVPIATASSIVAAMLIISSTQHVMALLAQKWLSQAQGNLDGLWMNLKIIETLTCSVTFVGFIAAGTYPHEGLMVFSVSQTTSVFLCGLILVIYDMRLYFLLLLAMDAIILFLPYHSLNPTAVIPATFTISFMYLVIGLVHERDERQNFLLKREIEQQRQIYGDFVQNLNLPTILHSSQGLISTNNAAQSIGITSETFLLTTQRLLASDNTSLASHLARILHNPTSKIVNAEFGLREEGLTYLVTAWATDPAAAELTVAVTLNNITDTVLLQEKKAEEKYTRMMLYSISHELRTPLNGIQGTLKFILQSEPSLSESARDKLRRAKGNCVWLSHHINDVLDYAQLSTNEFVPHNESFSVSWLLAKLAKYTLSLLGDRSRFVGIRTTFERTIPNYVLGDILRLQQVCLNLLSNAIKYTNEGYILIAAGYSVEEQRLTISVSDTGCGMTPEQLERLFAVKGGKTREGDTKLAGLGLTVTQLICQKLGGRVEITSEPKRGTTATVHVRAIMPLIQTVTGEVGELADERQPETPPQHVPTGSLGRGRFASVDTTCKAGVLKSPQHAQATTQRDLLVPVQLLVVDDTEMNRFVLCKMLTKYGLPVQTAANGAEAVEIIEQRLAHEPHTQFLVFMDLEMPVMGGLEAAAKIRTMNALHVPILVATTAFTSESERKACSQAGFHLFIPKPVRTADIRKALQLLPIKI